MQDVLCLNKNKNIATLQSRWGTPVPSHGSIIYLTFCLPRNKFPVIYVSYDKLFGLLTFDINPARALLLLAVFFLILWWLPYHQIINPLYSVKESYRALGQLYMFLHMAIGWYRAMVFAQWANFDRVMYGGSTLPKRFWPFKMLVFLMGFTVITA